MEKQLVLTPEELYFLGKLMQAKYIDYAYVAAMNDIGSNYALFEKETQAALVSSGVLTEDFSGNLEIDDRALALVKPIFFGEVETSLDICTIGETNTVDVNKFHFHDGAITKVTGKGGKLEITAVDAIAVQDFVSALVPVDYAAESAVVAEIDKTKITRLLAVKAAAVGVASVVSTYLEADGVFYRERDGVMESMTREMIVDDVYAIVKGA